MKTNNLRTKKKVTTEANTVEAQEEIHEYLRQKDDDEVIEFLKQDAEAKYEAQQAIEKLLKESNAS